MVAQEAAHGRSVEQESITDVMGLYVLSGSSCSRRNIFAIISALIQPMSAVPQRVWATLCACISPCYVQPLRIGVLMLSSYERSWHQW